ncbi:MAG: 1-(5-phosphoribosyl)-5-[(5-phosphoribosylamino)methylideneamino]imidazole-4-carboxamide isomerase [Alphaproteobacteria bacterium]|nr:1-(5-phosphoribosyl)-5-[(5-phosphoribosylamino)methylideneamino]imidazole-4-carboxamide isomerase [Alphaproteobacteria bacterium]
MDIFPAIDLRNGQCVRLRKGDFDDAVVYETNPVLQAQKFAYQGAAWLHVVDLDGAKDGAAQQTKIIANITRSTSLAVQVGGGIRNAEDIEALLDCGVRRVVVGSLAAEEPETVQSWINKFGSDCIVLALDVRLNNQKQPIVLTRGWQDDSSQTLWNILAFYEAGTILCTDAERDGMLKGPNLTLYKEIKKRTPQFELLASGGIASLEDIRALAALGAAGAITGKALYENKFTLKEVLNAC